MRSFVQKKLKTVQTKFNRQPDEELLSAYQSGDMGAAEQLMLRYKDTVLAIARKFAFRSFAEVDDLVQEGMIALYKAIGTFDAAQGKSFKNFVYFCVERRIYSYLRTVSRREREGERTEIDPEDIAEGENPEELLLSGESEREFRLRLSKVLSDFEFRVVNMYLEGMTYAQISAATGKQIKSIDNALARAKRKLSAVMQP